MVMMQPYQQSFQESSEESLSSNSIQVIHHIFNNVMQVYPTDRASVPKWMEYMHCYNINELCDELQFEFEYIHDYSDYIVNGQHCELIVSIMGKIWSFISWMSTRKKENTFQLSSEYLLSLTREDYIQFRYEDMIRTSKGEQLQHLVPPNYFPATLQEATQDQSSFPSLLTCLMNQIVIPLKQYYLKEMSMALPHLQL